MSIEWSLVWRFPTASILFLSVFVGSYWTVRWAFQRFRRHYSPYQFEHDPQQQHLLLVEQQRMEQGRGLLFWVATFGVGLGWLQCIGLLLLWLGVFRLEVAATLAGAVLWWAWRKEDSITLPWTALRRDLRSAWAEIDAEPFGKLLFFALFAGLCLLALRTLLLPPLGYDSLTYHATKAAFYAQTGDLLLPEYSGGWSIFRFFPPGKEVLQAWVMLPFSSDFLFGFLDVFDAVGLLLTAVVLLRTLAPHASMRWQLLLGWVLLSIPLYWKLIGAGYTEQLLSIALLQAVLFTGLFLRGGSEAWLLLSWVALGIAIAVKLPGLVAAAFLGALQGIFLLWKRRAVWKMGLAALGIGIFLNLPWMAWNTLGMGAPLSPYPLKIAGISVGIANTEMKQYMTLRALLPISQQDEWEAHACLFAERATFQHPVLGFWTAPLLAAGLLCLLWFLYARWWMGWGMAVLVAANLYGFYHPNFAFNRLHGGGTNSRFLLQSVAVLLVCLLAFLAQQNERTFLGRLSRNIPWIGCFGGISMFAWYQIDFKGWWLQEIRPLTLLAMALIALYLSIRWLATYRPTKKLAIAWTGLGLLLFCFLVQYQRDKIRNLAYKNSFFLHAIQTYFVEALPSLDQPSSPKKLAVAVGPFQALDNQSLYPLFGRRLQNKLFFIPQRKDGRFIEHDSLYHRNLNTFSKPYWLARLRKHRIDHVVALAPQSLEQIIMAGDTFRFARVVGQPFVWGVFQPKRDGLVIKQRPQKQTQQKQ